MDKHACAICGSASDLDKMKRCYMMLEELGTPYTAHVASAHRSPELLADIIRDEVSSGCGVFICAAGMAAHLAGAVAARTVLPVIGVPLSGGVLDGLDALLSTVQMPKGMPVATVAVGACANAAILASQILGNFHAVADMREDMANAAVKKNRGFSEKIRKAAQMCRDTGKWEIEL